MHLWFESIHPFEDCNGRLGSALAAMALAQDMHTQDPQATRYAVNVPGWEQPVFKG